MISLSLIDHTYISYDIDIYTYIRPEGFKVRFAEAFPVRFVKAFLSQRREPGGPTWRFASLTKRYTEMYSYTFMHVYDNYTCSYHQWFQHRFAYR